MTERNNLRSAASLVFAFIFSWNVQVGGGLLGGIAALGAGYYAYKKHEKNEEEEKAAQWGLQNWLAEAQKRKNDFYANNGGRAPVAWILTQGHDIPQGALVGGHDDAGTQLFVARAFFENGLHVGYASRSKDLTKKGAVISYASEDIHVRP